MSRNYFFVIKAFRAVIFRTSAFDFFRKSQIAQNLAQDFMGFSLFMYFFYRL